MFAQNPQNKTKYGVVQHSSIKTTLLGPCILIAFYCTQLFRIQGILLLLNIMLIVNMVYMY